MSDRIKPQEEWSVAEFREWQRRGGRLSSPVTPPPVLAAPRSAVEEEEELHNQIIAHCRRSDWLYFHGSMAHKTKRVAGEPDFQLLLPGGRFLLVECKSKTGELSPAQKLVKDHAARLGHTVHEVRSFEEFLKLTQLRPVTGAEKGEG